MCGSAAWWLGRWTCDQQLPVRFRAAALPGSDPGQVVHTHVSSASEVTIVLRSYRNLNILITSAVVTLLPLCVCRWDKSESVVNE